MRSTDQEYPPSDPDNVKIYLEDKPTVPVKMIGRVSVDKHLLLGINRSPDTITTILREKAASIGGDAVINVIEDSARLTGVVVIYRSFKSLE
jgi:hypothetical protein